MAWGLLLGAVRAALPAVGRAGASASSSQFAKTLGTNALGSVLGGGGGGTGGGSNNSAPAAPQPTQNSPIGQLPPKG